MAYRPQLLFEPHVEVLAALLKPAPGRVVDAVEVWRGLDAVARFAIGAVFYEAHMMRNSIEFPALTRWYAQHPLAISWEPAVKRGAGHMKLSSLYRWFGTRGHGSAAAPWIPLHHHLSMRQIGRQPVSVQHEVDQLLRQVARSSGASTAMPPKEIRSQTADPFPATGFITFVAAAYELIAIVGLNEMVLRGTIRDPRMQKAREMFSEWKFARLPGLCKRMKTAADATEAYPPN